MLILGKPVKRTRNVHCFECHTLNEVEYTEGDDLVGVGVKCWKCDQYFDMWQELHRVPPISRTWDRLGSVDKEL